MARTSTPSPALTSPRPVTVPSMDNTRQQMGLSKASQVRTSTHPINIIESQYGGEALVYCYCIM